MKKNAKNKVVLANTTILERNQLHLLKGGKVVPPPPSGMVVAND